MWCSVSPLHIQRQRLRSSRLTPHTCYGSLCEYMAHGCAKAYVCVLHSSSRAPLLVPWLGDVEGTSLYTVRPRVAKYNIYIHTSYIYSPKKSHKDSPVCIRNLYLQLGGRTSNLELALDLWTNWHFFAFGVLTMLGHAIYRRRAADGRRVASRTLKGGALWCGELAHWPSPLSL